MIPIQFSNYSPGSSDQLSRFLAHVPQKPFRFLHTQPILEQIDQYIQEDILALQNKDPQGVILARREGEIAGLAVCSELPWDSRVLQSSWGALKYLWVAPWVNEKSILLKELIERALDWAARKQIRFLVSKTYSNDIEVVHALERAGFLYMDTNLDYVVDLRNPPFETIQAPPLHAGMTLRLAQDKDSAQLLAVAGLAFRTHFSRFMVDDRIPKGLAQNFYVEWMRSCLAGYADFIYLVESDGKIAGYSIWKKPASDELSHGIRLGHYSIAGIHPDFAGMGLFSSLTYAGMKTLLEFADYIEGPTHINNYPVQRGYKKFGWQIYDARHAFHKWLGD